MIQDLYRTAILNIHFYMFPDAVFIVGANTNPVRGKVLAAVELAAFHHDEGRMHVPTSTCTSEHATWPHDKMGSTLGCYVAVHVHMNGLILKMNATRAGNFCGGGDGSGHAAAVGALFAIVSGAVTCVACYAFGARRAVYPSLSKYVLAAAVPTLQPASFRQVPYPNALLAMLWWVSPLVADGLVAFTSIILHPLHVVRVLVIQVYPLVCFKEA